VSAGDAEHRIAKAVVVEVADGERRPELSRVFPDRRNRPGRSWSSHRRRGARDLRDARCAADDRANHVGSRRTRRPEHLVRHALESNFGRRARCGEDSRCAPSSQKNRLSRACPRASVLGRLPRRREPSRAPAERAKPRANKRTRVLWNGEFWRICSSAERALARDARDARPLALKCASMSFSPTFSSRSIQADTSRGASRRHEGSSKFVHVGTLRFRTYGWRSFRAIRQRVWV